jgi:hypothetical protein
MNKKIIWLFALLVSLSFSSCITLLDEIKLNDDKSGEVFIGLESQMLGSILSMAKDQIPTDMMDNLNSFPTEAKKRISNIEGISSVTVMDQISSGRLGINFHFKNSKALNNAYYALMEMKKTWYLPKIIKIGKHKIKRKDISPQLVKQIEKEYPDLKDSELLKYLKWETVIKLSSNSKKIETEQTKSKVGDKNIKIRYSLTEIIKDEKSTAFTIRF